MKSYIVEKEFEHQGLKCVVLLLATGYRCGYVGVPKGHPLYNVDYMNCQSDFACHGGLTYAGGGVNSSYPISSDLWWFGFDCTHWGDADDWNSTFKAFSEQSERIAEYKAIRSLCPLGGEIRTTEFVENECKSLAEQLVNCDNKHKTSSDEQEDVVKQYCNENKDTVERYYNENNELGVLYSPGYGVGWSSMGDKELAYDKRIVEYWLTEHPDIQKMEMYLERIGYHGVWMGGYNNLKIAWIPKGTMFYIHEYDDSESIETPKSCGMMMT